MKLFRLLYLTVAVMTAGMLAAQTTQQGIVQEYNEKAKKTPLAGVELNIRSANTTASDKDGKFSLQFLTLKPGEKVNVRRIEKLGYEIFNKEAVEQWNINPKTSFVIVMCRSDRFKKIRDNYEKVSSESYARQLKKEEAALAKLKADGKLKEQEYNQQLIELRENYEKQLDNLDSYIDRFSRIDLSELSETEQQIIELVQQGKIDEAIQKYEEQNYVEKYIKETSEINEISSAIDKLEDVKASKEKNRDELLAAIDRQIETLKLAGGRENFIKIGKLMEDVAYGDTTNTERMFSFANFMTKQGEYEKAVRSYRCVIANCADPAGKFSAYMNLGNCYIHQKEFDKALSVLEEGSWTLPESHNESKARLLGMQASIMYQRTDFAGALQRYEEALKLVEGDGSVLEADILYGLGSIYGTIKNYEKGLEYLSMSKEIYSVLDSLNQGKYAINLLNIRKKEASQFFYNQRYAESHEAWLALVADYQELYDNNPEQYCKDYCWAHVMLAKCLSKEERNEDALAFLDTVVPIYERHYSQYPLAYGKEYMQCLNDYGLYLTKTDDFDRAKEYCDKSMKIAEQLQSIDPKAFTELYMTSLYSSGYMFFRLKEYGQALDYYSRSLEIERQFFDKDPKRDGDFYTSIMMFMGRCHLGMENNSEALDILKSARDLRVQLAGKNMGITSLGLAECHRYLGDAYKRFGDMDKAVECFETAFLHYKEVMESQPKWAVVAQDMLEKIIEIHVKNGDQGKADAARRRLDEFNN